MNHSRWIALVLPWCLVACGASSGSADDLRAKDGVNDGPVLPVDENTMPVPNDTVVEPTEPVIDISGRWGMFHFEDPVAVELVQDGSGLTGLGCAAGLPPPNDSDSPIYDMYCGAITGQNSARSVRLAFPMKVAPATQYGTEVIVSEDGTRMAGWFVDAAGQRFGPIAWLRLPPDKFALSDVPTQSSLSDRYRLTLAGATPEMLPAFSASVEYELIYANGKGIWGDLGAFWHTEISQETESAPIVVGPVPATEQTLPVSLEMSHDGDALTYVIAVTASGGTYEFEAVRDE